MFYIELLYADVRFTGNSIDLIVHSVIKKMNRKLWHTWHNTPSEWLWKVITVSQCPAPFKSYTHLFHYFVENKSELFIFQIPCLLKKVKIGKTAIHFPSVNIWYIKCMFKVAMHWSNSTWRKESKAYPACLQAHGSLINVMYTFSRVKLWVELWRKLWLSIINVLKTYN